jgi:hypothetical protein
MVKQSHRSATAGLHLSDDERSTLVWALEVARAVLLGDPDVSVLLADLTVEAEVLDDLADRLVLLGQAAQTDRPCSEARPGDASDSSINHPNLPLGDNRELR